MPQLRRLLLLSFLLLCRLPVALCLPAAPVVVSSPKAVSAQCLSPPSVPYCVRSTGAVSLLPCSLLVLCFRVLRCRLPEAFPLERPHASALKARDGGGTRRVVEQSELAKGVALSILGDDSVVLLLERGLCTGHGCGYAKGRDAEGGRAWGGRTTGDGRRAERGRRGARQGARQRREQQQ